MVDSATFGREQQLSELRNRRAVIQQSMNDEGLSVRERKNLKDESKAVLKRIKSVNRILEREQNKAREARRRGTTKTGLKKEQKGPFVDELAARDEAKGRLKAGKATSYVAGVEAKRTSATAVDQRTFQRNEALRLKRRAIEAENRASLQEANFQDTTGQLYKQETTFAQEQGLMSQEIEAERIKRTPAQVSTGEKAIYPQRPTKKQAFTQTVRNIGQGAVFSKEGLTRVASESGFGRDIAVPTAQALGITTPEQGTPSLEVQTKGALASYGVATGGVLALGTTKGYLSGTTAISGTAATTLGVTSRLGQAAIAVPLASAEAYAIAQTGRAITIAGTTKEEKGGLDTKSFVEARDSAIIRSRQATPWMEGKIAASVVPAGIDADRFKLFAQEEFSARGLTGQELARAVNTADIQRRQGLSRTTFAANFVANVRGEQIGRRAVASSFAKGGEVSGRFVAAKTAAKVGLLVAPAGAVEGGATYVGITAASGQKLSAKDYALSAGAGAVTAGLASGGLAGLQVAKRTNVARTGNLLVNVLDPYEGLADVTVGAGVSSGRVGVLTPTITRTKEKTFQYGVQETVKDTSKTSAESFTQTKTPVKLFTITKTPVSVLVNTPVKQTTRTPITAFTKTPVDIVVKQPVSTKTKVPVDSKTETPITPYVVTPDWVGAGIPFLGFGGGKRGKGSKKNAKKNRAKFATSISAVARGEFTMRSKTGKRATKGYTGFEERK